MRKQSATAGDSPPTDWQAIHRRLERAAFDLEQKITFTPEEGKRILDERAKILAREPVAHLSGQSHLEVVEFLLAYERYAVESAWVREVHPLKEITPLPGTPPFVLGIINVRGQIVSVVDLKQFFDLPTRGLPDLNRVIIIGDGSLEFGILADSVTSAHRIPCHELQAHLPTLTGIRAEFLKGVTAERLVVLDVARLLADPRIQVSQSTDA